MAELSKEPEIGSLTTDWNKTEGKMEVPLFSPNKLKAALYEFLLKK